MQHQTIKLIMISLFHSCQYICNTENFKLNKNETHIRVRFNEVKHFVINFVKFKNNRIQVLIRSNKKERKAMQTAIYCHNLVNTYQNAEHRNAGTKSFYT